MIFSGLDDDFTEVKHKLQVIKSLAMEAGKVSVTMERFLKGAQGVDSRSFHLQLVS